MLCSVTQMGIPKTTTLKLYSIGQFEMIPKIFNIFCFENNILASKIYNVIQKYIGNFYHHSIYFLLWQKQIVNSQNFKKNSLYIFCPNLIFLAYKIITYFKGIS